MATAGARAIDAHAVRELDEERARAKMASAYLVIAVSVNAGMCIHVARLALRLALATTNAVDAAIYALSESATLEAGVSSVTFIMGAVFFLRWFGSAFRAARQHGAALPVALGRDGGRAFFVPVLNLYRPYRALRALDDAIEPSRVPEPPPQPLEDGGAAGYRENAAARRAPRAAGRRAPLGAWWAFWLTPFAISIARLFVLDSWLAGRMGDGLSYASTVASGVCAIIVIQRIDARLAEYARKMSAV